MEFKDTEARQIAKEIVIAMIQCGLIQSDVQENTKQWNESSIESVKSAFNEIHETVKNCYLTNKPE